MAKLTNQEHALSTNYVIEVTYYKRLLSLSGLQVSVVGLERALNAYVKEAPDAPFDIKTVPLATSSMQEQMAKPGKPSMSTFSSISTPAVVQIKV